MTTETKTESQPKPPIRSLALRRIVVFAVLGILMVGGLIFWHAWPRTIRENFWCPQCGYRMQKNYPSDIDETKIVERCPNDGTQMVLMKTCPRCGNVQPAFERTVDGQLKPITKCQRCGARLTSQSAELILLKHWYFFALAVAVALLATPAFMVLAKRLDVMDHPDNTLKKHIEPTPYLGGVALMLGWLAAIAVAIYLFKSPAQRRLLTGIGLGGVWITFVGVFDDIYRIPPWLKMLGQLVAAGILIMFGIGSEFASAILLPLGVSRDSAMFGYLHWIYIPIVVVYVLGACNAANLLDGLDGLCAGVTGIMAGTCMVLALVLAVYNFDPETDPVRLAVSLALLGAVLGFLPYNLNPASIFMGDAGSLFLGFNAAVLILMFGEGALAKWVLGATMVFGLPIFDTLLAIIRRHRAGKRFSVGDTNHLHHQLVKQGLTVRQSVALLYVLAKFFSLAGVIIIFMRTRYSLWVYAVVICTCVLLTLSFRLHDVSDAEPLTDDARPRRPLLLSGTPRDD